MEVDGDKRNFDRARHTGAVLRNYVDEDAEDTLRGYAPYKVAVSTAVPQDLRKVSQIHLSMQPSTTDAQLSTVEGLLR